jgi:hypothetical protein
VIPAWSGLLHVVHNSINADVITLPPRALVPLEAVLTVTRKGTGVPTLAAAAGGHHRGQPGRRAGQSLGDGLQQRRCLGPDRGVKP